MNNNLIIELEILIILIQILTIPIVIFGKALLLNWQSRRWQRIDRERQGLPKSL